MRTRTQFFDKQQIRTFVKQAKMPWGHGWTNLSAEMKEGAIAVVAIGVVAGQVADSIAVAAVKQLIDDMRAESGLYAREEVQS